MDAHEFLDWYQTVTASATQIPTRLRADVIGMQLDQALEREQLTPEQRQQIELVRAAVAKEGDVIRHFADRLLECIPAEYKSTVQNIPVGTLPIFRFNAATIRAPDDAPIIVVDTGLGATLHEAAVWFAASMTIGDQQAEVDPVTSSRGLFFLTMFHLTREPQWLPDARGKLEAPFRKNIAGGIWTNAINFVLGHEYGHAILGHLTKASVRTIKPREDSPPLPTMAWSQSNEYDADHIGAEIALEWSTKNQGAA